MDVSPNTYFYFFDMLSAAIAKKANPIDGKNFNQNQVWHATQIANGKKVNICEHYLSCSFKYFIDGKTFAKKNLVYPVKDLRLIRALELIEETPVERQYQGKQYLIEAHHQLKKFEKKLPKEKHTVSGDDDIENYFFNIIETKNEISKAKKFNVLITEFFNLLNDNKKFQAWGMLSPALQKRSMWNGDYDLFVETFGFINKFETPPKFAEDFSYQFQKVKCTFGMKAYFTVMSFESFQSILEQDLYRVEFEFIYLLRHKGSCKFLPKLPNYTNLNMMNKADTEKGLFQLLFFTRHFGDDPYLWHHLHKASVKVENFSSIKVTIFFNFFGNNWLIDEIIFEDEC